MHPKRSIIVDETQFPEFVHEETDSRSSCANHLRESFVTDVRHHRLRRIFLSEIGEKKKEPGESLFARVEKLIDQVRLHSTVARQQIGQKRSVKSGWSWRTRITVALSKREIEQSTIAVAVEMRRGCPVRHPSPKKSPAPRIATTASLPCLDTVVILILPF